MALGASYRYDLGKGLHLDSFSIDPNISEGELKEMVSSKDGTSKLDLEKLAAEISVIDHLNSFEDLKVEVSDEPYEVPEPLRAYREAAERKWTEKGMFNGSVAIVKGPVQIPLRLCRGGYFDFKATQLNAVPGDLVPNKYPAGKTIDDLMPEFGITNDQRARYLGFAFIMFPNNRKELSLVQRAKGLGIAADCIATSGGTPGFDKRFFEKGFDFAEYYEECVAQEMDEEYKLQRNEFRTEGLYLLDDKKTVPHGAIEIATPVSTKELAQRTYGNETVIKEHPVLYAMKPEAISTFMSRFDMLPSTVFALHLIDKDRGSSENIE